MRVIDVLKFVFFVLFSLIIVVVYHKNNQETNTEVLEVTSTFLWNKNVDSLNDKKVGDSTWSPKFYTKSSDGTTNEWQLRLYPKGYSEEYSAYMALYLWSFTEFENPVNYSCSLINLFNAKVATLTRKNYMFDKNYGFGNRKFVKQSVVVDPKSNVLRGRNLTILCEIKVVKRGLLEIEETIGCGKVEDQSASRIKLLDDYGSLLVNKEFSDVVVTADGKNFHLHKCILATHSTVFEEMFRSDKNQTLVEIEGIRSEVLDELFRFIYTGKVDKIEGMASELLGAAGKYNVVGLKDLCEKTMCSSLRKSNAMEYLSSAIRNNATKLKSDAINFIHSNLADFVKESGFNDFGTHHPEILLEILKKLDNL